jgi:hypothetical protein
MIRKRTVIFLLERGGRALGALFFLAISLALGGFFFSNRVWFIDAMGGPTAVPPTQMLRAQNVEEVRHRYITLDGVDYRELGIDNLTIRTRFQTYYADYVLIRVQDRWLIAEVPHGERPKTISGYLVPREDTAEKKSRAGTDLAARFKPRFLPKLLPFQLDAVEDHFQFAYFYLVGGIVLTLVSLAFSWLCIGKLFERIPVAPQLNTPQLDPVIVERVSQTELPDPNEEFDWR